MTTNRHKGTPSRSKQFLARKTILAWGLSTMILAASWTQAQDDSARR